MKKLSLFLVWVMILMPTVGLLAQNNMDEEMQLVRDQWGVDKKQLIMQYMSFTDAESKAFWPVYDAYAKQHRKLMDSRIALIKDYAKNYQNLSNAKATELTNKLIDNDMAISQMQKTYYAKFSTAITPKRATKYMQVEYYLLNNIKTMVQDEIPFIGEMDKSKKEVPGKNG
jgi:Spy/CpxP family protein refolding chaperone